MKKYKHLNKRHIAILKFISATFKWMKVYIGIATIFVSGFFLFVKFVNRETLNLKNKNFCTNSESILVNNPQIFFDEFDESTKNELILSEKSLNNLEYSLDSLKKNFKKELYDFSEWNAACDPELVVINKKNPLNVNFSPNLKLSRGKQVSVLMSENLENLIHDAYKEDVFLYVISGYRTPEHQKYLFEKRMEKIFNDCSENGLEISHSDAEFIAEKTVQKPLQSEHNTGLAVDFNDVTKNFKDSKEYVWLHKNAYKYGFIERYQANWESTTGVKEEPWHFRYVGIKNAEKITNSQMCLEEYLYQKSNHLKS